MSIKIRHDHSSIASIAQLTQQFSSKRLPATLQSVGAIVRDIVLHSVNVAWDESVFELGQK